MDNRDTPPCWWAYSGSDPERKTRTEESGGRGATGFPFTGTVAGGKRGAGGQGAPVPPALRGGGGGAPHTGGPPRGVVQENTAPAEVVGRRKGGAVSVLLWNAGSLVAKLAELQAAVEQLPRHPEVVVVTETHLDKSYPAGQVALAHAMK